MVLKDYEKQIFAIRDFYKVGYDIAVEMFLNNIADDGREGDQYFYHGATGFDYSALKPHLDELRKNKQEYINLYQPKKFY